MVLASGGVTEKVRKWQLSPEVYWRMPVTVTVFDGGARLGTSLHDEGKPLDIQLYLEAV